MSTKSLLVCLVALTLLGSLAARPQPGSINDPPKKPTDADKEAALLKLPAAFAEVERAKTKVADATKGLTAAQQAKARAKDEAARKEADKNLGDAKTALDDATAQYKSAAVALEEVMTTANLKADLAMYNGPGDDWTARRGRTLVLNGSRWKEVSPPHAWSIGDGKEVIVVTKVTDGTKGPMWQFNKTRYEDISSATFQPYDKDGTLGEPIDLVKDGRVSTNDKGVTRIETPLDNPFGGIFLIRVKPLDKR